MLSKKNILITLTSVLAMAIFLHCTVDEAQSKSSELPHINIVKTDDISWTEKEPCLLIYSDRGRDTNLPASIKRRGGISTRYYKHSFTIKLNKKFRLCNITRENDWILNANYIDKTFMRHKISYDLFREMNPKNISPKCAYAFVEHNSKPMGLYVIMEKINGGMIGINKTDTMAMVFKEPKIFFEERLPAANIRDTTNYYDQRFPDIEQLNKTWFIEGFKNFLFYSNDNEFLSEISKWIDIESVIDWHLLLLLTNNSDGIMKNFFLYKIDACTPLRIAIWDYDHSFGRDGDNELNMMERELDCNRSILLKRLMEIPNSDYPDKLAGRWHKLRRKNIFSYINIETHINENNELIENAVEYNAEIWPVNSNWYFDDNNYYEELEIIREYTKIRLARLDEHFSITEYEN